MLREPTSCSATSTSGLPRGATPRTATQTQDAQMHTQQVSASHAETQEGTRCRTPTAGRGASRIGTARARKLAKRRARAAPAPVVLANGGRVVVDVDEQRRLQPRG
eukprot:4083274-Prymnesium_polylepis.1